MAERRAIRSAAIVTLSCLASLAWAEKGDGSFRIEYQYIRTGAFDSSIGDIDIGSTDGHAFLLSFNYALTDRWSVTASLPWIRKRHRGALPHDPVADFSNYTPPDLSLIDDGEYHSDWQDLYLGASYRLTDGPLVLQPFVSVGFPTNDYPFYGHAAVGRNIWHVPIGVAFSYQPYFSDFRFAGDVAYVFTEKSLGADISHWLMHGEVGYFITRNVVPKVFVTVKHGNRGLDFPDDYDLPADFDTEKWYLHDRMIKHNFVNAGLGLDWAINNRYQVSGTWFRMVRPEQVNVVDRAWTVSITRFFGTTAD